MFRFDKGHVICYKGQLFQVTDTDNDGLRYRYQLTPVKKQPDGAYERRYDKIRWVSAASVDSQAEFVKGFAAKNPHR
jgi:hypothetical protein